MDTLFFDSYNSEDMTKQTEVEISIPTICPCCNKVLANKIKPLFSINNLSKNNSYLFNIFSIYKCCDCNNLFIVKNENSEDYFAILEEEPKIFKLCNKTTLFPFNSVTKFSENIRTLSLDFVETYNEAEKIENLGLKYGIDGMAYRKSLEYLIDAYLRYNGINVEGIDKLGEKIRKIKDDRIRELSKKASWLGNDYSHPINEHPDYSISDMKSFIKALVGLIDYDFAYEKALNIPRKENL